MINMSFEEVGALSLLRGLFIIQCVHTLFVCMCASLANAIQEEVDILANFVHFK